jgi:hypothetical protein
MGYNLSVFRLCSTFSKISAWQFNHQI